MSAIYREWCKQNPGKKMMEFGGKETQRIYEKVTGETSSPAPGSGSGSKTPSVEEMVQDQSSLPADGCPPTVKQIMKQEGAEEMVLAHGFFVIHCDGCTKPIEHGPIGLSKLPLRCSRCRTTFYHNRECQRAHYKEHKIVCREQSRAFERDAKISREPAAAAEDSVTSECGLIREPAAAAGDECGICLQVMVSPIALGCSHRFCHGCMRRYQDHVPHARCALCRGVRERSPSHTASKCATCWFRRAAAPFFQRQAPRRNFSYAELHR